MSEPLLVIKRSSVVFEWGPDHKETFRLPLRIEAPRRPTLLVEKVRGKIKFSFENGAEMSLDQFFEESFLSRHAVQEQLRVAEMGTRLWLLFDRADGSMTKRLLNTGLPCVDAPSPNQSD